MTRRAGGRPTPGNAARRKAAAKKTAGKTTVKTTAKRPGWQPAPKTPGAEKLLAVVRRACLALPDTTEKVAWGAPTFRVRERLFVMFSDNHHGDGRLAIWINAAPGAQEAFVAHDPGNYFVPPYVGPSGWLGVRLDRGLEPPEVEARIQAAHAATLAARAGRARRRTSRRSVRTRRT